MSNYIVEILLKCDMKSHKEPNPVVKRYFVTPGTSVGIPELDKDMMEHGFDRIDLVAVEVYKNVKMP